VIIMPGNSFGNIFKITSWGESHGPAIGVVVEGCPHGMKLSVSDLQKELDRRRPGQSAISTQRAEDDKAEILSGVFEGKTTGMPISIIIKNKDADSSRYEKMKSLFRPGHADFAYQEKYGIRDYRGGGRSSGRETAARAAPGAIAKVLLAKSGIKIYAFAMRIGTVTADKINLDEIENNAVRCADKNAAKGMEKEILKAKEASDSIGGVVEIIVKGCPAGLGDPVFDKLDADLAKALVSIGAVKGIEFGSGFSSVNMNGSENNDEISSKGFLSNNSGGILGGISTGQDIVMRIAVKPTASIAKEQKTVDINNKNAKITVEGRHDPCIVPRIIPVAEAMVSLVIADKLLMQRCVRDD